LPEHNCTKEAWGIGVALCRLYASCVPACLLLSAYAVTCADLLWPGDRYVPSILTSTCFCWRTWRVFVWVELANEKKISVTYVDMFLLGRDLVSET